MFPLRDFFYPNDPPASARTSSSAYQTKLLRLVYVSCVFVLLFVHVCVCVLICVVLVQAFCKYVYDFSHWHTRESIQLFLSFFFFFFFFSAVSFWYHNASDPGISIRTPRFVKSFSLDVAAIITEI